MRRTHTKDPRNNIMLPRLSRSCTPPPASRLLRRHRVCRGAKSLLDLAAAALGTVQLLMLVVIHVTIVLLKTLLSLKLLPTFLALVIVIRHESASFVRQDVRTT